MYDQIRIVKKARSMLYDERIAAGEAHVAATTKLRWQAESGILWTGSAESRQKARTKASARLKKALTALEAAYEQRRAERAAKDAALEAESLVLRARHEELLQWEDTLRDARRSAEGLAPWDALALDALRAWGDVPAPSAHSAAPAEMLKGSEVAALFKERIGVSRATYYGRYRVLLRSCHITPVRAEFLENGGAVLHPGATMRFRREEVEALLSFLVADAS